jgi:putative protease
MSAKDLCTLPFIEKLKKAGITAFKIEGRNRDPKYADAVVRVYRKALDKKLSKKETSHLMEELKKVYNRGFSSGFYLGIPTSDDFATIEHSAAKEKKHFIGKVLHYYPNIGVATIKLVSKLKINEDILFIGKFTGVKSTKIDSIQIKQQPIDFAEKGQEIGIKIPFVVRKGDEVYLIKKI